MKEENEIKTHKKPTKIRGSEQKDPEKMKTTKEKKKGHNSLKNWGSAKKNKKTPMKGAKRRNKMILFLSRRNLPTLTGEKPGCDSLVINCVHDHNNS